MKKRIALINPRFSGRPGMMVHHEYEPIGIMMVSASLRRKGMDARIFEQPPECSAESLARQVLAWRPDAVGVSVYTANYPEGRRIARELKAQGFGQPVVFGGTHATTVPEIVLDPSVDYVLRGEGEVAGTELFHRLIVNKSVDDIPGVVFAEGGSLKETSPFELISDLTALPWADRSGVRVRYEYSLGAFGLPKAIVMSSRGCRSACIFCAAAFLSRRQLRMRRPDDVVGEIKRLKSNGTRFIYFGDDDFFSVADHAKSICRALIEHDVGMPFYCMGRVERLSPELLDLLARAGCRRIFTGLVRPPGKSRWTSNARDGGKVAETLGLMRRKGIFSHVGFMIGFPDETRDSLDELHSYVRGIPADYLSVTIVTPFRGTVLYDSMIKMGIELSDDEEQYVYNSLCFRHPNLTADELLVKRQQIYRSFYFGRSYLKRAVGKIMSSPSLSVDYARLLFKGVRGGLLAQG